LFKDHPDELPRPGDTYLLWSDAVGGLRHVGITCYVPDGSDPDDCWVTADGGQGSGKAQRCELVPRNCVLRPAKNPADSPANTPHLGGGAEGMKEPLPRLYGWVDLEHSSLADLRRRLLRGRLQGPGPAHRARPQLPARPDALTSSGSLLLRRGVNTCSIVVVQLPRQRRRDTTAVRLPERRRQRSA
jgi:hypothetical protein